MLLVKTEVKPSSISGLGLFAVEDIMPGQLVWKYDTTTCLVLSAEQCEVLNSSYNDQLSTSINSFGYPVADNHTCILYLDNTRYINHSRTQYNLISPTDNHNIIIASRCIEAGEELIENYLTMYPYHTHFFSLPPPL